MLKFLRQGAVGFIVWLGRMGCIKMFVSIQENLPERAERICGDINFGVVHSKCEWRGAKVSEHQLQSATSTAEEN
jgi:hypothetical protein